MSISLFQCVYDSIDFFIWIFFVDFLFSEIRGQFYIFTPIFFKFPWEGFPDASLFCQPSVASIIPIYQSSVIISSMISSLLRGSSIVSFTPFFSSLWFCCKGKFCISHSTIHPDFLITAPSNGYSSHVSLLSQCNAHYEAIQVPVSVSNYAWTPGNARIKPHDFGQSPGIIHLNSVLDRL